MPDRAAANTPGTSSVRLRRLLRTPLLVKILVANGAVVALGATVGTALTAAHVRRSPDAQAYGLMVVFAVCGLAISLVVNGALLRAALRPLARLEVVARRVSAVPRVTTSMTADGTGLPCGSRTDPRMVPDVP